VSAPFVAGMHEAFRQTEPAIQNLVARAEKAEARVAELWSVLLRIEVLSVRGIDSRNLGYLDLIAEECAEALAKPNETSEGGAR